MKRTASDRTTDGCNADSNTAVAPCDTDGRIRQIAARFHGVVSRVQLITAGVPVHAIDYRLKHRRLHAVFTGVYRVGPVAARREREAAALLACGDGAILSHGTAAHLWRLPRIHLPRNPHHSDPTKHKRDAPVDVTVTTIRRRRSAQLRLHRVTFVHPEDVSTIEGLMLTTPARTIVDLAAFLDARQLEQVVAHVEREGLTDHSVILATVERLSRRPGAPKLRALITADTSPSLTRSEAEEQFLSLIRRGQLPAPRLNARVCGYEVDVLWPAHRLIVEVDGFAFHSSRHAFESDRKRDGRLNAGGYRVMRITWRQLQDEPEAVLVRAAQALAAARETRVRRPGDAPDGA